MPSHTSADKPEQTQLKHRAIHVYRDGLELSVVGQCSFPKLTTDARLLETTKRKGSMEGVVGVDPNRASPQAVGNSQSSVEVLGVNGRSETEGSLITKSNGVCQSLKFGN